MATNSPIPTKRLEQITNDACESTLSTASAYDHAQTTPWNNCIINSILKSLISETSSSETKYKFAVNSTIIQHLSDPQQAEVKVEAEDQSTGQIARRGMHSASGAYWNNERDAMWSHKYDGGGAKGMDIVVSIMWVGI